MVAPNTPETVRVGQRGTITIPLRLRERLGIGEGSMLLVESRPDGLLIRPAVVTPEHEPEAYTKERVAEFLINNAVGREEYEWALKEARRLGVDPRSLEHILPPPSEG